MNWVWMISLWAVLFTQGILKCVRVWSAKDSGNATVNGGESMGGIVQRVERAGEWERRWWQ